MEFFVIYLLMIIGNLKGWFIAIAVAASAITLFKILMTLDGGSDVEDIFDKFVKYMIAIALTCSLLACLIPSKQDMAMIAAGGVTYKVLTSDAAKEVGGKGLEILNKRIDSIINEKTKD